jgi:hypothetical protein
MPQFEKGNKVGRGRPPGKLNRSTEQAKLAVARLANNGLSNLQEDLEKIRKKDPLEAAKIYLKLIEYIVPKKAQIEMKAEVEQKIQQITVHVIEKDRDGIKHTNE